MYIVEIWFASGNLGKLDSQQLKLANDQSHGLYQKECYCKYFLLALGTVIRKDVGGWEGPSPGAGL